MTNIIEPAYSITKVSYPANCAELISRDKLISMYVDWVNNFLTADKFAEYYRIDVESAKFIISEGRYLLNH